MASRAVLRTPLAASAGNLQRTALHPSPALHLLLQGICRCSLLAPGLSARLPDALIIRSIQDDCGNFSGAAFGMRTGWTRRRHAVAGATSATILAASSASARDRS